MRRNVSIMKLACIALVSFVVLCINSVFAELPKEFAGVRDHIMSLMKKPGLMSSRKPESPFTSESSLAAASKCAKKVDKNFFDLSPLGDMDFKDQTNWFDIQARLCNAKATRCAEDGVALCQFVTSEDDSFVIARWSPEPVWSMGTHNGKAALQLNFENGDKKACNGPRKLAWKFICDPAKKQPTSTFFEETTTPCSYVALTTSEYACATKPKSDKGGLSGGTIFLIILLVVIPVYITAGCIYNYKKTDKRGCQACPQHAFWAGLCVNAKAGCAFTWAKLRGLCSGKRTTSQGEYDGV